MQQDDDLKHARKLLSEVLSSNNKNRRFWGGLVKIQILIRLRYCGNATCFLLKGDPYGSQIPSHSSEPSFPKCAHCCSLPNCVITALILTGLDKVVVFASVNIFFSVSTLSYGISCMSWGTNANSFKLVSVYHKKCKYTVYAATQKNTHEKKSLLLVNVKHI